MHQYKKKKIKHNTLRITDKLNVNVSSLRIEPQSMVLSARNLTESTYVVRFERNGMQFLAGQHITLGLPSDIQIREYSIYSPVNAPYLEVLIKEVKEGTVSRKLHKVREGDLLKVDGPFGFFTLDEESLSYRKFLFIATGTGIAPFHSMIGSYPNLNYKIFHGVRYAYEAYERNFYPKDRYTLCTSRETKSNFNGRVTDYLFYHRIDSDTFVYLCGNCDMINEVYNLLVSDGFNPDQIKTEVYF